MEIDLDDFVRFYKLEWNIGADRRYSNRELWKLKAYSYCVVNNFGFSINKAAQAIHKHHTTIMHHLRKIGEEDKIRAYELGKNYIIFLESKNG